MPCCSEKKDSRFQIRFTVQVLVLHDGVGCWYCLLLVTGQSDIFTGGQRLGLGEVGLGVVWVELILETGHHGVSSAFTVAGAEKEENCPLTYIPFLTIEPPESHTLVL